MSRVFSKIPSTIARRADLGTAALVDTGTGAANVPTITQADARYLLQGIGQIIPAQWLRTGHHYANLGGPSSTLPTTLSRLVCVPIRFANSGTLDRIGVEVTTGVGTALLRTGLYADNGNIEPGALIADYGADLDGSGAAIVLDTISQAVTAGTLYWLAVVAQTAAPTLRSIHGGGVAVPSSGTTSVLSAAQNIVAGHFQAGITGALPDPFVSAGPIGNVPRILVRAS